MLGLLLRHRRLEASHFPCWVTGWVLRADGPSHPFLYPGSSSPRALGIFLGIITSHSAFWTIKLAVEVSY